MRYITTHENPHPTVILYEYNQFITDIFKSKNNDYQVSTTAMALRPTWFRPEVQDKFLRGCLDEIEAQDKDLELFIYEAIYTVPRDEFDKVCVDYYIVIAQYKGSQYDFKFTDNGSRFEFYQTPELETGRSYKSYATANELIHIILEKNGVKKLNTISIGKNHTSNQNSIAPSSTSKIVLNHENDICEGLAIDTPTQRNHNIKELVKECVEECKTPPISIDNLIYFDCGSNFYRNREGVIINLDFTTDSIVLKNINLLNERSKVGIKKYGTTLQDNPLTLKQTLQHAIEEGLDWCNYLQKAKEDLDKFIEMIPIHIIDLQNIKVSVKDGAIYIEKNLTDKKM